MVLHQINQKDNIGDEGDVLTATYSLEEKRYLKYIKVFQ